MTLLKEKTASNTSESLRGLGSRDVETDCCMHSLHSPSLLEKDIKALNINDPASRQSCESGIASFSENYCSVWTQADRVVASVPGESNTSAGNHSLGGCHPQRLSPMLVDHGMQRHGADCGSDQQQLTDRRYEDSGRVLWEEMCDSFPDKDGDTVLHLAVIQAVTQLAGMVRLLGLQSQVNCRNRLYQTPLHLAVLTGNAKAVGPLLSLGASFCAQDCRGNTPLHAACHREDVLTLRTLLEGDFNGKVGEDSECPRDDVTATSHEAFRRWREREVKVALGTRNYDGLTCLHVAVMRANPNLVLLLLQHGADINAKDGKSGRTSLHLAVDSAAPSSAIISTLLHHPHLHINATNFALQTALQLARGRRHFELVDLLHVRGADWSDSIHSYYSSDSFSEEDVSTSGRPFNR